MLLFAGVGAVLASHSIGALVVEAAGVAILLLLSGRERQVRSLRLMGPMVALVFVLGIVFIDFETALSLALRVFSLLGISAVCFASLHPEEVGASLAELKIPPGPAFMLTAGLRYVPLIEQKIRSIRDAQQARGIDLRPRLATSATGWHYCCRFWSNAFCWRTSLRSPWRRAGFPASGARCGVRRDWGSGTGRSWSQRSAR